MKQILSNRTWAKLVVDFFYKKEIRYICMSPGSRNTPLTEAFINHGKMQCFSHIDERSLCYYAVGIAKASGKPVAVLTTSGTATANLFPGIIEAKLSNIPLFILTADRPLSLLNTGSPQTINQKGLYGEYVNKMLDIDHKKTYIPECFNKDYELSCENYESTIKSLGGIDIQVLGIGTNGHIGFNEPTSSLNSRTRVKTLTQNTIENNSRFFKDNETQPSLAITMGIGTIMEAKNILLIGLGKHKSKAVAEVIEGPLSAFCPGSALQNHENVHEDILLASLIDRLNHVFSNADRATVQKQRSRQHRTHRKCTVNWQ